MERHIAGVLFRIIQGDIARITADAVVNAANNHLWMGSGVAGAIKRWGGDDIEAAALAQGPIPVGHSVVTPAGRLPARHVIHAAVMGQDLRTTPTAIRAATRSALEKADALGLETIALPAFGTGVGGFAPRDSADAMIPATLEFVSGERSLSLKEITFVLFSPELATAFEQALMHALNGH